MIELVSDFRYTRCDIILLSKLMELGALSDDGEGSSPLPWDMLESSSMFVIIRI